MVLGFALCSVSLACGPAAAPPTAVPTSDPFAVVRATSQAAYTSGKAALDRGDFLQACVQLDTAKTADPDNRSDIQQALEQALQRCLTPPPEATAAPATAPQRTLVVATAQALIAASPAATAAAVGTQAAAAAATPAPQAASSPSAVSAGATTLVAWRDPQGRFTISAPADWSGVDPPQPLFGIGSPVVQFRDATSRAELDVAVDTSTKAVSPELYSAGLELAMQQQVPGYASEQAAPGVTSGNPSLRRVFTFSQRDASGQDHQTRGFQVTVVKGSTPYIISGRAPADQYQQYSPTFDRIVESFRFS